MFGGLTQLLRTYKEPTLLKIAKDIDKRMNGPTTLLLKKVFAANNSKKRDNSKKKKDKKERIKEKINSCL